jgi:nucleoside-diphosphate-sugar epimerase
MHLSDPFSFAEPLLIAINHLKPQDWYGLAKLHAECRHRALAPLPIVDIRIFNYFSHTQDLEARFLITDILRAIRDETVLKTSAENIFRDFLHPSDFYQLVTAILTSPATNTALDCFTKAPIDKISLLEILKTKFGLKYEVVQSTVGLNLTGNKTHYYSLNKRAEDFGYRPMLNSLDGILNETTLVVNQLGNRNKSSFA